MCVQANEFVMGCLHQDSVDAMLLRSYEVGARLNADVVAVEARYFEALRDNAYLAQNRWIHV
jgi:hypothetical protein